MNTTVHGFYGFYEMRFEFLLQKIFEIFIPSIMLGMKYHYAQESGLEGCQFARLKREGVLPSPRHGSTPSRNSVVRS